MKACVTLVINILVKHMYGCCVRCYVYTNINVLQVCDSGLVLRKGKRQVLFQARNHYLSTCKLSFEWFTLGLHSLISQMLMKDWEIFSEKTNRKR